MENPIKFDEGVVIGGDVTDDAQVFGYVAEGEREEIKEHHKWEWNYMVPSKCKSELLKGPSR